MLYFNPHLPCGRRLTPVYLMYSLFLISIHTFLAEGDYALRSSPKNLLNFNPHLPCGRRLFWIIPVLFTSFISIHTFLAEGDIRVVFQQNRIIISIHTFLAEGDVTHRYPFILAITFQSTPSLRKATANISQITSEFLLASNKTLLF